MRNRSVRVQPLIHPHTGGGFQEITRCNEDQLPAIGKVTNRLLDEEQIEIRAQIEQIRFDDCLCLRMDVLISDVRRIPNDRCKFFHLGVRKKNRYSNSPPAHVCDQPQSRHNPASNLKKRHRHTMVPAHVLNFCVVRALHEPRMWA